MPRFHSRLQCVSQKAFIVLVKGQLLPKLIMRLGTCMGNTPLGIAFVCLLHLFVYFVCCGSLQDQHPTGHHMISTCGCTQTPKNIKLDSSGISVGQLAGGQVARRQQLLSLFCCPLSAVTLTLTLSWLKLEGNIQHFRNSCVIARKALWLDRWLPCQMQPCTACICAQTPSATTRTQWTPPCSQWSESRQKVVQRVTAAESSQRRRTY